MQILQHSQDYKWFKLAIDLAKAAKGRTYPNPAVGCVVVKNGQLISVGASEPAGQRHAEIVALDSKSCSAQNSTMYVTLEPCCHFGRTPPCTTRIIDEKVGKVKILTLDPNPEVSGKGLKTLEDGGVRAGVSQISELVDQAYELNEDFFYWIKNKKPFITAKWAGSIDGLLADDKGDSKWLTGEEARLDYHQLRARSQAILIGAGTANIDDPQLSARLDNGVHCPQKIVLDPKNNWNKRGKLLDGDKPVIHLTSQSVENTMDSFNTVVKDKIIQKYIDKDESGWLDWNKILAWLGSEQQISNLIIEGGSKTLGSAIQANIIHKVVWYISPIILSGSGKFRVFQAEQESNLGSAWQGSFYKFEQFGKDIKLTYYAK
jgi:diaminohydroxyphosphoribosylaminopyrimidine deaminase / 5-amino-6-(5-phosphoribosylamino)uracil reductase